MEGAQTVNRGELFAITRAIMQALKLAKGLEDQVVLEVRSDSAYAVNAWQQGNRFPESNLDLWITFWKYCDHPSVTVTLTKVMAHANDEDVQAGRTTLEHIKYNALADTLAGEAATAAAPPEHHVNTLRVRKWQALMVQRRFVTINMHCAKEFPYP